MTDVQTPVVETQEFVPLPLEEHTYFELGGTYCFIANTADVKKHIDALWPTLNKGPVYYLFGCLDQVYEDPQTKKKTSYTLPRLFRVALTPIGSTVSVVDYNPGLESFKPQAVFDLPKLPYDLISKLDAFFRMVDDKYGTEAIVMLTYNNKIGGSEGWGILVPKQSNTAAHCDYEPQSVVEEKDPDAKIVGTVHSHPGMSAFASTTDHEDQANMDGLHITYGWQPSVNNGATQYWIEFQLMGQVYQYQPEQIFEMLPAPKPTKDVEEWVEKVSKKAYTPGTGTSHYSPGYTTPTQTGGGYNKPGQPSTKPPRAIAVIPKDAPQNCILIGEAPSSNPPAKCPFCKSSLLNRDFDRRRCMSCHLHICLPNEGLEEMVEARKGAGGYVGHLDVTQGEVQKDIYIWRPGVGAALAGMSDGDASEFEFELVYEFEGDDSKKADGGADTSDSSYSVYVDRVWCESCQRFLKPSQIDMDFGTCVFCNDSVYDSSDTESITVMCDVCQAELEYDTAICDNCNTDYPSAYWIALAVETVTETLPGHVYNLTEQHNVCCDNLQDDCKCDNKISWYDLWDVPNAEYVNIYDYHSDCHSCEHFSDPQCRPLRSWLRSYFNGTQDRNELGQIDGCEDFTNEDSYYDYNERPFHEDLEDIEEVSELFIPY